MAFRGPQVLRDRDQLTSRRDEVGECGFDLCALLAEAQNQIRLGDETSVTRLGDDVEGARVGYCGTDALDEPWNSL